MTDAFVLKLSGLLVLMYTTGYLTGLVFRATRQFLEKAAN